MGSSLFDQLKKSGLVTDKQARQARHNQQQQKGKQGPATPASDNKKLAQQAQAEKQERDRLLNQQRQEEAARKALAAQINQMIESNRIENRDGEIVYNFSDGKMIRRLHVNAAIHKQLCNGEFAIAKLAGRYELVASDIGTKIAERDPKRVILITNSEATAAEDDPYADYKVPDDLMW